MPREVDSEIGTLRAAAELDRCRCLQPREGGGDDTGDLCATADLGRCLPPCEDGRMLIAAPAGLWRVVGGG